MHNTINVGHNYCSRSVIIIAVVMIINYIQVIAGCILLINEQLRSCIYSQAVLTYVTITIGVVYIMKNHKEITLQPRIIEFSLIRTQYSSYITTNTRDSMYIH